MKPAPGQQTLFGEERRSALPQYDAAEQPAHQCRESTACKCSMIGTEPAEHCPVHGCGDYPPRCAECGKYMPVIPLNSTVDPSDAVRLGDQHHAILAALRTGPKSGPELATIAIRYSARLNEMKAAHPWLKRAIGGGQFEYRLADREDA